ncbi:ilGF domain-containing protein [Trichonephila inaurata madagascariensis]|uniref:IlGF domain-containing protein n=1 Tax=Trichonephila inaurata madagascariensis TaxID=2747483 RepID=A0A8X6MIS4_9ARAC|nr:ilGF domain-containing protein [Trichonephila inaurata madagascariensis]
MSRPQVKDYIKPYTIFSKTTCDTPSSLEKNHNIHLKMGLRPSILILLGFVAWSALYGENAEGVRMCGRRLADLLNIICEKHGGFHAPRARREVSDKATNKRGVMEIFHPVGRRSNEGNAPVEVEMLQGFRSGVVDECCRKQCTLTTLVSYCANSRHVGSIDLDEIVPPGTEHIPALSAEDIAEFHEAAKGATNTAEPNTLISRPAVLGHPSRPNLGQFMRNRPVFIVMSQLQDDEDRALGDYRF